jgi:Tol biopolymer transport system component
MSAQKKDVVSTLEVFNIETNERTEIYQEDQHFEAPNWSPKGDYFLVNQAGSLFKIYPDGKKEKLDTGFANRCNNDHGISFDGQTLAFSHNLEPDPDGWLTSCIFTMPLKGGTPKRVTDKIPSFWHGWSPDGKTLLYTARRDGVFNVFSIPTEGGEETQLTDSDVLDDGPAYARDGKHIYYNSMQSGRMEIWRMHPDGSNKEQLTDDEYSNWFAHPSPDGKHLVFISYLQDQGSAHPAMKEVVIRLYTIENHQIRILCGFTGGQGSLNVPSWSPDSKEFAFVSYRKQ